jgi:biopolymer transport protein ExbB/TolQ
MIRILLYLGGVLIFGVTVFNLYKAWYAYREAKAKQKKIEWAVAQADRAIEQINSDADDIIIAGLQTLSMLNVPEARLKALRRLSELTHSSNQLIVTHADANIEKVTNSAEE